MIIGWHNLVIILPLVAGFRDATQQTTEAEMNKTTVTGSMVILPCTMDVDRNTVVSYHDTKQAL